MTDYEPTYNELAMVNDETYFVQDGPLFDEPMVRSVEDLLECERDSVQIFYLEDDL